MAKPSKASSVKRGTAKKAQTSRSKAPAFDSLATGESARLVDTLAAQVHVLDAIAKLALPPFSATGEPEPAEPYRQTQRQLHGLLARLTSQIGILQNVDASAPPAQRARTYRDIAGTALQTLHNGVPLNVLTFLVRTGWHEGQELTRRVQMGGGPARGFVQMEAPAAIDGIDHASSTGWLPRIGQAVGRSVQELRTARQQLTPQRPSYPDGNLVGHLLATDDIFGLFLARSYLAREAAAIPTDLIAQADYWETYWHRVPNSAGKAQFIASARRLNSHLGWT